MRFKTIIVIILVGCLSLSVITSCKTSQAHKHQKKIDKTKAERKKETEVQYQDAVKRHQNIQTKDTKKRMKNTNKKSEKINKPKEKTFFMSRWFSKKRCLD